MPGVGDTQLGAPDFSAESRPPVHDSTNSEGL